MPREPSRPASLLRRLMGDAGGGATLPPGSTGARLRAVLDAVADAIVVHDLDGNLLDTNHAAATMLGYSAAELASMKLADIQHELDLPAARERWLDLAPGQALAFAVHYRRNDGSVFPVEVRLRAIDAADEERCIVVTARDTSEQREFEQQLRHSQKLEAVGRLAGGVAHDFNNLLTAIKGHTELLLQDATEERVVRDLREISKAADRAAALTRKLLAFSRQQMVAPEVIDMNGIVADTGRLLRPLIGERIEYRAEAGSTGHVRADRGQIEQVLVNLVVNARDAMPNGGALTLRTRDLDVDDAHPPLHPFVRRGHYVALEVIDTGTGMDAATLARIFEPFFTTKDSTKGSGLGLAIAYGIVKQAGGYLIAESQPGRGSTLHLLLPRSDAAIEPHAQASQPLTAGDGRVALVVEDEDPVRDLVARVLRMDGFRVIEAASGEEAVVRAAEFEGRIDLVVTDLVLTGMDGRDLADALATTRPGTPIILMSGYSDMLARPGPPAAGPNVLHKPFTPTELRQRVLEIARPAT